MSTVPAPLLLPDALRDAVGRGVILLPDAETQLLGGGGPGSLTRQLSRVFDEVTGQVREALKVPADLPLRTAHPWTLLTEFESPVWPLLALRDPPPLSAGQVARLVRHLGSAHQAMPPERARQLGGPAAPGGGSGGGPGNVTAPPDATDSLIATLAAGMPPTWAAVLAGVLSTRVHHLLLGSWGVLSAFVGLHPEFRVQGARQLLAALHADPWLVRRPEELTRWALWSALTPLHGGAPPPADLDGTLRLARSLRRLPERTQAQPLPDVETLAGHLRSWLPDLPEADVQAHAADLRAGQVAKRAGRAGADAGVGVPVLVRPGRVAYWLRVGSQVQLIVSECSPEGDGGAGGDGWVVWAWQWFRPAGVTRR